MSSTGTGSRWSNAEQPIAAMSIALAQEGEDEYERKECENGKEDVVEKFYEEGWVIRVKFL